MKKILFLMVFILAGCSSTPDKTDDGLGTVVPVDDLSWIANKVFLNETSGDYDKLVFWSQQEEFMSLGIAHFIWYPQGQNGRYTETFPDLIKYFESVAEPVPQWVSKAAQSGAPWQYRQAFLNDRNSYNVQELRQLLSRTMNLQANFMAQRLKNALPLMTRHVSDYEREKIIARYKAIEKTNKGLYPLLDYVNFKGEGTAQKERYQGQGWGLLQVLQAMPDVSSGANALNEFANAAEMVLKRRIRNSPPERREQNWLAGWTQRTNSYRPHRLWR
jgi:hypothetical protein